MYLLLLSLRALLVGHAVFKPFSHFILALAMYAQQNLCDCFVWSVGFIFHFHLKPNASCVSVQKKIRERKTLKTGKNYPAKNSKKTEIDNKKYKKGRKAPAHHGLRRRFHPWS